MGCGEVVIHLEATRDVIPLVDYVDVVVGGGWTILAVQDALCVEDFLAGNVQRLGLDCDQQTTVKVTAQWTRYHIVVTVPGPPYYGVTLLNPDRGDTVWADAMQLESGAEPTAFEN